MSPWNKLSNSLKEAFCIFVLLHYKSCEPINLCLERSDDQESAKQNSPTAAAQNNQEDSGEESPPPLPPRRRLEAAATADEPDTKRSRPSEHGMSQRRASTQKTDKHKNKSMMRRLFHLMPTERETKADSDYSGRQSSRGRLTMLTKDTVI